VLVVNDETTQNKIEILALKMALPSGVNAKFVRVDKARDLLKDEITKHSGLLVIVRSPDDALAVLKQIEEVPQINLGNYGKMHESVNPSVFRLNRNFVVTEKDFSTLKVIASLGADISLQRVPSEKPVLWDRIVRGIDERDH
jgi:PTS system mannose-specific IIB component